MNKNFLIIFVFILFTNNSLACDALRLTGTKVSTAQKTFFIIEASLFFSLTLSLK